MDLRYEDPPIPSADSLSEPVDCLVDLSERSLADLQPTPSRYAAEKEEHRLVADAVRNIPLDLQIVIELHYWEDLTTAEIADVLSIPVGTAKSRLRRAREAVEAKLRAAKPSPKVLQSTLAGFDGWVTDLQDLNPQ